MLHTRITELLGLSYPIMSSPMTGSTSGQLAAAVSLAGGLGSFGGINPGGPEWVHEHVRCVRSQTNRPFGVGFITHYIPLFLQNFTFSFADPQPWLGRAKEAGAITVCQVQSLQAAHQAVAAGADIIVV